MGRITITRGRQKKDWVGVFVEGWEKLEVGKEEKDEVLKSSHQLERHGNNYISLG